RRTVYEASALEDNLGKHLDDLIGRIEAEEVLPHKRAILARLKDARAAVASPGSGWPKGVKVAVSNAGGRSIKVGTKLARIGVEFIDYHAVSKVRGALRHVDPFIKAILHEFAERAERLEFEASKALMKRAQSRVARGTAGDASKHAARFVRRKFPRLVAKLVSRASARRAARRALSFVPVAGWGFA